MESNEITHAHSCDEITNMPELKWRDVIIVNNIDKYVIKYLDKDDIINLGFSHFYDDFSFGVFNLYKDELFKYQIDYDYESNFMEIGIFTNDGLEKTQDIFVGKIKNKHELRTLLIQLEIINE